MARQRERLVLEHAVDVVAQQAAAADALVDEALEAGLAGPHPVALQAKMLRLELLNVKADLERELGQLRLDCTSCGRTVHWIADSVSIPATGRHSEPAPHHEPEVRVPDPPGSSALYFRNTTEIRDAWHRRDDRRRTHAEATRELDPV